MAHPILDPASHCEMILDSQARYAFAQALGSRNASTYGPDDGSSGGPARTGPRSNGMGRSNCMVVEVAESSSIPFGAEVAIFRVLRKLGESEFGDSRLNLGPQVL